MKPQAPKPIEIPINKGNRPDWQIRLGYPQALNLFVGESGYLYSTPGKTIINDRAPALNVRQIFHSAFKEGNTTAVNKTQVYQIYNNVSYSIVGMVKYSGKAVEIQDNDQNQIIITDGKNAYVYDQNTEVFTTLGETQGFDIEKPIAVDVLNNVAYVLGEDGKLQASAPNNFLEFPVLDYVPEISSQSTKAVGLKVVKNNLFIFGTTGIDRWVPSSGNNPYIYPITKDENFHKDIGAISTNGMSKGIEEIYFLSNQYVPMVLSERGLSDLVEESEGIARIISQYPDANKCIVSFFQDKGHYFVSYTFPLSNVCWVYAVKSKSFTFWDDIILAGLNNYETIATPEGIFQLKLEPDYKHRSFTSELIRLYKGIEPNRMMLNSVEVQIIQGLNTLNDPQKLELTLSIDTESWTNTVDCYIGRTGERNALTQWGMSIAAQEVVYRVDYYGEMDLTISKIAALVN